MQTSERDDNQERSPTEKMSAEISPATDDSSDSYKIGNVTFNNTELVTLTVNGEDRVCLAQLSNLLLSAYSYNEIHNRRVALGITCVQCTPLQLEVLRRSGAMPLSSRRCGLITRREAERLYKSFYNEMTPPALPEDFVFSVYHRCGWGCSGYFIPSRYNSSRAKCIKCAHCNIMFSPNKFIFHCHKTTETTYVHPDAANFNSWRRHIELLNDHGSKQIQYAWEDVKALFNGGSRKRTIQETQSSSEAEPSKVKHSKLSFSPIREAESLSQMTLTNYFHRNSMMSPQSISPPLSSSTSAPHLANPVAELQMWMRHAAPMFSNIVSRNLMLPSVPLLNQTSLNSLSHWSGHRHSSLHFPSQELEHRAKIFEQLNKSCLQKSPQIRRPWLTGEEITTTVKP